MLYDYDVLDRDDEIGEAKLAVADLKSQEEKDIWLNVEEMASDHPSQHKVSLMQQVVRSVSSLETSRLFATRNMRTRTTRQSYPDRGILGRGPVAEYSRSIPS